jgi:hypothetical protein
MFDRHTLRAAVVLLTASLCGYLFGGLLSRAAAEPDERSVSVPAKPTVAPGDTIRSSALQLAASSRTVIVVTNSRMWAWSDSVDGLVALFEFPFFSLLSMTTMMIGLWKCGNLAFCARFPSPCGNRSWVSIGTSFPQPSGLVGSRRRDRNSGDAVPLSVGRSSFLAPPTWSWLIGRLSDRRPRAGARPLYAAVVRSNAAGLI